MLAILILAAEEGAEETVNPLIPPWNEVIWGSLSFLVLFFLLSKFAFPAVKKGMDARADRIRASLDEADKAKAEAGAVLAEYQRQLEDARSEAGRIIESARQDADRIRQELRSQAENEVADLRRRAMDDINAHVERVKANLRVEVARLSVELAEKVVERNLDRDTNMALVERFIEQASRQTSN